jgi:hypothetical protein
MKKKENIMGAYVYTLRKASRNIISKNGKSKVQHFAYAFKPSSMWGNSRVESSMIARANKAYESYKRSDLVVIKDVKDDNGKASDLDYQPVFNNLPKGALYDNDMHSKMNAVGYLRKQGKQYELVESQSIFENDEIKLKATVIPRWSNNEKSTYLKDDVNEKIYRGWWDAVIYEWEWKNNKSYSSEKGYKVLIFDPNSVYANSLDYSDIAEKVWKYQQKVLLQTKED